MEESASVNDLSIFLKEINKQTKKTNSLLLHSFQSTQNSCNYNYRALLICSSSMEAKAFGLTAVYQEDILPLQAFLLKVHYFMTQLSVPVWFCS